MVSWYYEEGGLHFRQDRTMSQTLSPSILDRMLEPVGRSMSLEFARELVELQADPNDQARIDELAEKCNEGLLTDDERAEYERYVQAIHLIGVLQQKAKRVLAAGPRP
jgi:hypothetical protein